LSWSQIVILDPRSPAYHLVCRSVFLGCALLIGCCLILVVSEVVVGATQVEVGAT
jgi:hypothetical protein